MRQRFSRYRATKDNKRTSSNRANGATPRLSGDVPRRQPVDQTTVSIKAPTPTGSLCYRQIAPVQTFQVSAGAASAPVITFALNGITGAGTLASTFDLYRIEAIRMTIRPNNNAIGLVDPTVTLSVPLYWVIDYTDSVPLPSAATATEYDNCMVVSPGESAERTFRPMYSLVAKSSAGTDYISRTGDWLDTSSDDILHYGCKFYIPAGAAVQTFLQTWTVEIAYFLTFRQVS